MTPKSQSTTTPKTRRRRRRRLGPLTSLFVLSPVFIGVPWLTYRQHTTLPEPLVDLINPQTNLPQISESRILGIAKYLSEDIGFRTPGTYEHALGDKWMYEQVVRFREDCERIVNEEVGGRRLECEIWRQEGSGSHRFDMMGERLYKTYVNLSNIIVRVSDGTPQGKQHAVLVNSHLDSTLPTPGAADDALAVGIMLECMRVLVQTPGWEPKYAIVFLFNNAEESLQDGSHLFSTQHPIAPTIRAVINLEAAGTTGRELLFQATSEQMIEAYSHVPYPFGTVVANDVFSSGIILSDTDFRQFEYYLNVPGLDIAVVGNSYLYHMRKDLVENIQPGLPQNMALNTLALLHHLSTPPPTVPPSAQLPALKKEYGGSGGSGGNGKPQTVFYSLLGWFFMYSFRTAKILSVGLGVGVVGVVFGGGGFVRYGVGFGGIKRRLGDLGGAILVVVWAFVGSLVGSNVVAVVMRYGLGKPMSWFSNEYSVMLLYVPPSVLGALLSQRIFPMGSARTHGRARGGSGSGGTGHEERMLYSAVMLIQAVLAVGVQVMGVGSASLFFLVGSSVFCGAGVDLVRGGYRGFARGSRGQFGFLRGFRGGSGRGGGGEGRGGEGERGEGGGKGELGLLTYGVAQVLPLVTGTMAFVPALEVFVPLTGRMGASAPADNLIATIVSCISAITFPLFLPFIYRFDIPLSEDEDEDEASNGSVSTNGYAEVDNGATKQRRVGVRGERKFLNQAILFASIATVVGVAIFGMKEPFDEMHQKRVFIMRTENVTTNEHHLHISTSDGAAGFEDLVREIAFEFGGDGLGNGSASARRGGKEEEEMIAIVAPEPIIMDHYNSDWDPMYPFSMFLTPYKIPLAVDPGYISPWSGNSTGSRSEQQEKPKQKFSISAVDDVVDFVTGTRSLRLEVYHPGLIWTVIAFDAHVLKWNLDENPPNEHTRHHVKEASFYGTDIWSLDLVIKLPSSSSSSSSNASDGKLEKGALLINFIGLQEDGMWPGKKAHLERAKREGQLALPLFERIDEWIERRTGGKVDAMLLGCVAGVELV